MSSYLREVYNEISGEDSTERLSYPSWEYCSWLENQLSKYIKGPAEEDIYIIPMKEK